MIKRGWTLLLTVLLFSCVIISSCKQNSRVSTDAKTVSMHFDSAYRYVVNNMVVANSNPDTFLSLCDDMTSVSPSLLEPRQVRQWAHSYALAASVYISNNDLKKALEGTDIDEIKKKNEELNKVAMDLAGKVYEQAAKEAQANQDNNDDHETVEDATYEEK